MAFALNQRSGKVEGTLKRRMHVLVEFPDPRLESVVVQWDAFRPTVLVQLKRDPREPLQFPGKRSDMQAAAEPAPADPAAPAQPHALDFPLLDFVDGSTGRIFGREAPLADIVFSQRAFSLMQPEPDLVLPADALWECRAEALQALGVMDEEGTSVASRG